MPTQFKTTGLHVLLIRYSYNSNHKNAGLPMPPLNYRNPNTIQYICQFNSKAAYSIFRVADAHRRKSWEDLPDDDEDDDDLTEEEKGHYYFHCSLPAAVFKVIMQRYLPRNDPKNGCGETIFIWPCNENNYLVY